MSRRFLVSIGLIIFIVVVAVLLSWMMLDGPGQTQIASPIEVAFPNLSFNQPVGLYSPNDNSDRFFVVEQQGVIRVFNNSVTAAASSSFRYPKPRHLWRGARLTWTSIPSASD